MKVGNVSINNKIISIFVVLLMFQGIIGPLFVYAESDAEPPIVESIEVSPGEVAVGETVTVKAKVTDEVSGIQYVYVNFNSPTDSRTEAVHLEYNEMSGLWEGSYTVKPTDEAGKWTFWFMGMGDNAGNRVTDDEIDNEGSLDFVINNINGDGNPPVVETIQVSPVEVAVGDTVTVKAKVTDENSGVKYVYVNFNTPTDSRTEAVHLEYNEKTGLWEGSYTVKPMDEEGKWTFWFIGMGDNAGNRVTNDKIDNEGSLDFVINNSNGDASLPVVESLQVSTEEVATGDIVTIKAKVTDENSGVKYVYVNFNSPTDSRTEAVHLEYNEISGLWEGNYIVKLTDETGKWAFWFMGTGDNAGNRVTYSENEIPISDNLNFTIKPTSAEEIIDPINDPSLHYYITTTNETWTNEVIDKDVYIGPDSVITVNGNVKITGDVYVYGALKSYGDLTINGTLNAKSVTYGSSSTLYNGSVQIVNGQNNISSTRVSNQAYEIPFVIHSDNLTNATRIIEIDGKTLPFLDVYVQGEKVTLQNDGKFKAKVKNVTTNKVTFTVEDVFGNSILKSVEVVDVNGPVSVSNFDVTGTTDQSIDVTWDGNVDSDLSGYVLYLNNQVDNVSAQITQYSFGNLQQATIYELSIVAIDSSNNNSEVIKITSSTKLSVPVVDEVSDQDMRITGTAYAGSTVKAMANGSEIGTGTTEDNGSFTIEIAKQKAGIEIVINATDEAGNNSETTVVTVKDATAPSAPQVEQVTDQDTVVTGKAEVRSTVIVRAGESEIGAGITEQNGSFEINIATQKAGTELSIIAIDAAGNESEVTVISVNDTTHPTWKADSKINVEAITESSVTINWTEAEDNVEVTNYHVYQDSELIRTVDGSTNQISITNFQPGFRYNFMVEAVDQASNSTVGPLLEVKTLGKTVERISGQSRLNTAIAISQSEWETADTVILARGYDFPDALAATPLAYKLNAPILLTQQSQLSKETIEELKRLQTDKVIIVGGPIAISELVEEKIIDLGINVERIAGQNRFETASKIADKLGGDPEKAIVTDGFNFPDALAVSSYAAQNGFPIVLTQNNNLPVETKNALSGIEETITIGGELAISKSVYEQLPEPIRISGGNRYETAVSIVETLNLPTEKVYVATGENFADALTGSVIAAKNNAPLLLVRKDIIPTATAEIIKENDIRNFTILGGEVAVSNNLSD